HDELLEAGGSARAREVDLRHTSGRELAKQLVLPAEPRSAREIELQALAVRDHLVTGTRLVESLPLQIVYDTIGYTRPNHEPVWHRVFSSTHIQLLRLMIVFAGLVACRDRAAEPRGPSIELSLD